MSIHFDKVTKTFYLDGKGVTYAFFINSYGYAEHLYYGARIPHDFLLHTRASDFGGCEATPPGVIQEGGYRGGTQTYNRLGSELSFFGTGDYREPCVQVRDGGGDRISHLTYHSHEILTEKPKINGMPSLDGGETLVLHLFDGISCFGADLYYTVYDDCDVIARRIVYKNLSDGAVSLLRAYSFTLTLHDGEYDMLSLFGGWANERQQDRVPLRHGVTKIDSKRGASSAQLSPFMAICDRSTTEQSGDAFGVSLIYSGSYALVAERTTVGHVLLTGGINDFDFEWVLESGEELETPEVVIAYSAEGLGGMSRALHDAYREHLINKRYVKSPRPILINNWEATYFDFTPEKLCAIIDAVNGTGIDTFVLDDGWFGKRNDATSGLGDWVVNEEKLPGGLKSVIDHAHSRGMKFGLWFEPEMICEDSDIFRAHPDYAIGIPYRPHSYCRYQFVMDLTRREVRDYIVESVNKVIRENEIDYVKWDFNRNLTEFFSEGRAPERQAEFAHRYVLGFYELCDRIVSANPEVFFEGCSSGGGRFDAGVLHYFPQIWTSDNSDAEDRTSIQYGTSYVFPLSAMSCHVSAVPNHQVNRTTPLATRADIAHLGATGYELDTTAFTDVDREAVRRQIADYREIEGLVLTGDLYRLDNPADSNYFTELLVSKDKGQACLTCYKRLHKVNGGVHRVRLAGLDASKKYYVRELGLILGGATLMSVGIFPEYPECDFGTVTYHIEEK